MPAMKLSTRTRFGSRAMAELASVYPDKSLSVADLARSQRLSPKYLAQILTSLQAAGLLRATRGKHGGYTLARPPGDINLFDVARVFEGSLSVVDCVDRPDTCPMQEICPTRDTWAELQSAMHKVLHDTTFSDLAARRQRKIVAASPMYFI